MGGFEFVGLNLLVDFLATTLSIVLVSDAQLLVWDHFVILALLPICKTCFWEDNRITLYARVFQDLAFELMKHLFAMNWLKINVDHNPVVQSRQHPNITQIGNVRSSSHRLRHPNAPPHNEKIRGFSASLLHRHSLTLPLSASSVLLASLDSILRLPGLQAGEAVLF